MYLLTETASPFALESWAAFFANFGQFAKVSSIPLAFRLALIVALLLGLIFGAMSSTHNKRFFVASHVFMSKSSRTHPCLSNSWLSSMGFQS